jgi:transcriptional repressor NrdR
MDCPFCNVSDSSVKDSRVSENGCVVRRRRYCNSCNSKFSTFERIQLRELFVLKKSGVKKIFDRDKVRKSIVTAMRKRNISDIEIDHITKRVTLVLENNSSREVSTKKIGELIMEELAKIDHVAYIRFASVYKDFNSVQDFAKFVNKVKADIKKSIELTLI